MLAKTSLIKPIPLVNRIVAVERSRGSGSRTEYFRETSDTLFARMISDGRQTVNRDRPQTGAPPCVRIHAADAGGSDARNSIHPLDSVRSRTPSHQPAEFSSLSLNSTHSMEGELG